MNRLDLFKSCLILDYVPQEVQSTRKDDEELSIYGLYQARLLLRSDSSRPMSEAENNPLPTKAPLPTVEERLDCLEKTVFLKNNRRIRTLQTFLALTAFLAIISFKISLTGNKKDGFSVELSSRDATEVVIAGCTAVAFVFKPDLLPAMLSTLTALGATRNNP